MIILKTNTNYKMETSKKEESFTVLEVLQEESDRRKNNGFCFNREVVYVKLRKPLSKKHSTLIGYIILWYFRKFNPEEFKKLVEFHKKEKPKEPESEKNFRGAQEGKIYENKRVFSGKFLGETHDMSLFPDDLLRVLEVYVDSYYSIKKDEE